MASAEIVDHDMETATQDLEVAITAMSFVEALGRSLDAARKEANRLESLLHRNNDDRNNRLLSRTAPNGYVYRVGASYEYEVAAWHGKIGYGGESGWDDARPQRHNPQVGGDRIFIADTLHADERGVVWATDPTGRLRLRLDQASLQRTELIPVMDAPVETINNLLLTPEGS